MRRLLLAFAAALGFNLLVPGAALAYQGGGLKNHSHSSAAGQGGATLSPSTLTVTGLQVSTISANSNGQGVSSATIRNLTVENVLTLSGSLTRISSLVATSSFSANMAAMTTTATSNQVCRTTVAITVPTGSTYFVILIQQANATNSALSNQHRHGALQNGVRLGGTAYVMAHNTQAVSTGPDFEKPYNYVYPVGNLTAGTYSFCAFTTVAGGTETIAQGVFGAIAI